MLDKYRTLPIKESKNQINSIPNENNGQCIAMYVRRADKSKEMKLLPFSRFSDAAEMLWEAGYMNNSNAQTGSDNVTSQGTRGKPVIFIGTEDSSVLREAMLWGKKKGYQVRAEKITVRTPFHTYIHTYINTRQYLNASVFILCSHTVNISDTQSIIRNIYWHYSYL